MYPAMCADTGMLVGILIFFLVAGAAVIALFVSVVVAITKLIDARRQRPAAGS